MLAGDRQRQRFGAVVVQSPAHARLVHPAAQQAQAALIHRKTVRQRWHLQQRQHIFRRKAAVRQRQQAEKGEDRRMRLAGAAIGDRERQVAIGRRVSEDRLNKGSVAVDIGHHHDNIARFERGIRLHHRQQMILQHFHFALGAVADLHANRPIVGIEQTLAAAPGELFRVQPQHRVILQVQQIVLHGVQQVVFLDLDEGVNVIRLVHLTQQEKVVAAQLAPGGQQRVAELLFPFRVETRGRVERIVEEIARLFAVEATPLAALQLRQEGVILNIAPVIATGIGKQQMNIDMAAKRLQRLEIDRRQGGDAADKDALWQAGRRMLGSLQRVNKARVEIGAVPFRLSQRLGVGHQIAPERRLPQLRIAQSLYQLALLPAIQPVGAIDQILVKEIGNA